MEDINENLTEAVGHHQAGRLEQAAKIYRRVLEAQPDNPDALHLLGMTSFQRGETELALRLLQRAVQSAPETPLFWQNLGFVLLDRGFPVPARDVLRQALRLDPTNVDTLLNLTLSLERTAETNEAVQHYNEALRLHPGTSRVWIALGDFMDRTQRPDEAVRCLARACSLDPSNSNLYLRLGDLLLKNGKDDEARGVFTCAVQQSRQDPRACMHLSDEFLARHQPDLAELAARACLERVLEKPEATLDLAQAYKALALVYLKLDKLRRAEVCLRTALELDPDCPASLARLGLILASTGRLAEGKSLLTAAERISPHELGVDAGMAMISFYEGKFEDLDRYGEAALQVNPKDDSSMFNIGAGLVFRSRNEEAISYFRRAIAAGGRAAREAHSQMLLAMNYTPSISEEELFQEYLRWSDLHAAPAYKLIKPHANDPDPSRRLRIGFVSPDSGQAVRHYLEPFLENVDRSEFELFAYSNASVQSGFAEVRRLDHRATATLQKQFRCWRNTCSLSDDVAAELVRRDKIDILIDIPNHNSHNRLLLFARKPAPVQITWIGYINTTGLRTMDYRFTDPISTPPGRYDHLFTERLVYLPATSCYRPPVLCPAVGPLPADRNGYITFGAGHFASKLFPDTVPVWAEILHRVPDARLVLNHQNLAVPDARRRISDYFAASGIEPRRVRILHTSHADYMAGYNEIDIALDSFPFNGTSVSCEALWMGVPIVTRSGPRFISRFGLFHNSMVGLEELVAKDASEYVALAIQLAGDRCRLRRLRSELRKKFLQSPMMDVSSLTRNVEGAFRRMWRDWCGGQKG